MLLGGEPADGPRFIWWNFVASSRERIEQAKADWKAGPLRGRTGRDGVHPAALTGSAPAEPTPAYRVVWMHKSPNFP